MVSPSLMLVSVAMDIGLTCFEVIRLLPHRENMEAMGGRLKEDPSGFLPGDMLGLVEVSWTLFWELKLDFLLVCLSHLKGLGESMVIVWRDTGSCEASEIMGSWKRHQW